MVENSTIRPGDKVLVLGLGRSGYAAARLLAGVGAEVTVADGADGTADSASVAELESLGVVVRRREKGLPDGTFVLCVVSPGIDVQSAVVREAFQHCGEVISELELGYRHCRCPILAVTGTNGKSTLTKLLSDMLAAGGMRSEPSGNYGIPLCASALRSGDLDWVVAEVSSFQLELVHDFRPRIGVMLNLQPDHLGRHGTMESYAALKARLFSRMRGGDTAFVYEPDAQTIRSLAAGAKPSAWIPFGTEGTCPVRYDAEHQEIHHSAGGNLFRISLKNTYFGNPVTGLTAAAAVGAGAVCGLDAETMSRAIASFVPLSHRMENAGTVDGILFINDSKATNLTAMRAALDMIREPVRLIAGGQLKEKDLTFIKEVLKKRVLSAYLIGESAKLFASEWKDSTACRMCGDLETAVTAAWDDALPGDVVLLSPGCASFDQFRSYADRGEQFREFVKCIASRQKEEDAE